MQGTTQEVAKAKCSAAAKELNAACVTEDTALCFDALGGLPGPYIKDFLGTVGHDGEFLTAPHPLDRFAAPRNIELVRVRCLS